MILQNYGYSRVPLYMQKILDEIIGVNRFSEIRSYTLYALFFGVLTAFCMYLMRKMIISVSRKIEYSLRRDLYEKILELDFEFYQKYQTGDLISRCTNDLNDVRTLLGPGIMYVPNSISRLALFIPILVNLNARLMAIIGSALILLVIFILIVMPRMRPLFKSIQEHIGRINSRAWQVVSGINSVKLNTLETIETQRFKKINREYIHRQMKLVRIRGFIRPFFIYVFAIIELVILLMGGREIISARMTLGQLLQFNTMIAILIFPVISLGWVMSLLQQGISALSRIAVIFDYPVEKRKDWILLDNKPLHFSIRSLNYRYPASESDALEEINMEIKPGQVIGITGSVGSGKSTIVNLLTGIIKPERSMIYVNDCDIRDIDPQSLYHGIAIVPQEPFLFSATVADNIGLSASLKTDQADIQNAANQADIDRDIRSFASGYEQMVGERGITLSGGQKQRIAIARAFRKNSSFMIFDDSLSSVDSKTANEILKNIRSLKGNKTILLIAHRVAVLKESDIIYVFDKGNIVEKGTHFELLRQKGLYTHLWKIQHVNIRQANG